MENVVANLMDRKPAANKGSRCTTTVVASSLSPPATAPSAQTLAVSLKNRRRGS